MNKSNPPSADILSKILLIQNMLGQFSNEETIIDFVSQGLSDLPGVKKINYLPANKLGNMDKFSFDDEFKISIKNKIYGKFFFTYSNSNEIAPYVPYIQNICFMIAIILEERHQRKVNQKYQEELENKVRERTSLLSIEINERIKTEKKALEEKQRAEEYLKISEAIIVELDKDANITNINEQGCKILQFPKAKLIGKNWFKIAIPPNQQKDVQNVFNQIMNGKIEVIEYYENQVRQKTGNLRDIAWHNTVKKDSNQNIIGTLSSGIDITENKKFLESLQKTEKLESLGVLAGGIAHDFNNLLSGLFGYLDLALYESEANSEINLYLTKAMSVFKRTKDLTQQLLTFSKGGTPNLKTSSISDLIINSVNFALSGSKIKAVFDFSKDLWLCDFDENQFAQVFDNLTINSIHAMPEGGKITVTGRNINLNSINEFNLSEGKYLEILFIDEGTGIEKHLLKKIFDPFLTTKKMGSGLGLATSYSIIKKHNGSITVKSTVGSGTSFKILLPASNQKSVRDNNSENSISKFKGKGTILIMDDEDFILDVASAMLDNLGFKVDTAKDGDEVLKLITNNPNYCAIILDLTIPNGLGGKDIINTIRKNYRELPIFAASGYFNDPVIANPNKYGFTNSIRKPFIKKELVDVLEIYL